MSVEVMMGEREREARLHDSVVLSRLTRNTGPPGPTGLSRPSSAAPGSHAPAASASASSPGGGGGGPPQPTNCNLRVSSMRTVKSYKLLSSTAANPQGFYIATHRYAFSVKALQRMLVDPGAFHADVYLQGEGVQEEGGGGGRRREEGGGIIITLGSGEATDD